MRAKRNRHAGLIRMCGSATGDDVAIDIERSVPSPCRCRRRDDRRGSRLHNAEAHCDTVFGIGSDRSNGVALGGEITLSPATCEHARLVADGFPPRLGWSSSTGRTALAYLRGSLCPLRPRSRSKCASSSRSASRLDPNGHLRGLDCRGSPRSKWVLKHLASKATSGSRSMPTYGQATAIASISSSQVESNMPVMMTVSAGARLSKISFRTALFSSANERSERKNRYLCQIVKQHIGGL